MKIVLAEMCGDELLEAREFVQPVVRIGRDPETCQIVFEQASWPVVSRRHGEFRLAEGRCLLADSDSSFGTFLDGRRITEPAEVPPGALVQFGADGPVLRVLRIESDEPLSHASAQPPRQSSPPPVDRPAPVRSLSVAPAAPPPAVAPAGVAYPQATLVAAVSDRLIKQPSLDSDGIDARPFAQTTFAGRQKISVGRAADNCIQLDGLQISSRHARFVKNDHGIVIEDAGSTNGVFVNGARVAGRAAVRGGDVVQIGPFVLRADPEQGVRVFDMRSKTRIDVVGVSEDVPDRSGRGRVKLLDDISLTIRPNEFVGLLGPSGAGKSTLMEALNGMRRPAAGRVFVNNLDLYRHLDSLKGSIGYVPQEDIVHRELTIYRTLLYVARLRLSRDVSKEEADQIIGEVLDVTGLAERRDVPVAQLSGGQRKRVSIAVELITNPSIVFLDEPTSGLDPATEEKIMKLFRQIAESGRTVILTTHAMENVRLFDKVVVLVRGRLVFYGTPEEALAHTGAANFRELYDKLEAPIEAERARPASRPPAAAQEGDRAHTGEAVAREWECRFRESESYERNVVRPLGELNPVEQDPITARRRPGPIDAVRQCGIFTRRYLEVFARDRVNLLILFGQAPIIGFLTHLVTGAQQPRDFPYFMLALVAVWFGTSVAAREVVKERPVYKRERMVNLRLPPYVASKVFVLSLVVSLQCVLLFGTLKVLHYAGSIYLPGSYGGLPQLLVMVLTGMVGIALGLFVSAAVRTSEMATSLVPLILVPQLLFSGLIGAPTGAAKAAGALMPATWSFDAMKRLSSLDTLNEEGSIARYVAERHKTEMQKVQAGVDEYARKTALSMKEYERRIGQYLVDVQANPGLSPPAAPTHDPMPRVSDAPETNDRLKDFVSFTHPWGGRILNPLVLFLMFLILVGGTAAALRAQDAG